ncbi:hypothetical protein GF340_00305 [Candidatus Peregrinibacteria bacterium]|nr:hypothetical protein [Candidatus Peregrinibacteria bacterium]
MPKSKLKKSNKSSVQPLYVPESFPWPIPEQYAGQPVNLNKVSKNPYEGLERASGAESINADIRAIANEVQRQQEVALGMTVVTHRADLENVAKMSLSSACNKMASREGIEKFFIMDQDGKRVFVGMVGAGALQSLGSFTPEIHDELESIRKSNSAANGRHLQTLTDSLNLPDGGLIFETGAGADYERMSKLSEYAKGRNGVAVCHDLPPAASRTSVEHLDDVPYISLPHRKEFLVPALSKSPRPKIVTLKDTVSSTAFGSMAEIVKMANAIDAQKIVFSQSLNVASASNVLPQYLKPGDPAFQKFIHNNLMKQMDVLSGKDSDVINAVVEMYGNYFLETFYKIIMEYIRYTLMLIGKKEGYKYGNTMVCSDVVELEKEAALKLLSQRAPHLIEPFNQGDFNSLELGPFGIGVANVARIEKDKLRFVNKQFHMTLSKNPVDAHDNVSSSGQKVRTLRNDELLYEVSEKPVDEKILMQKMKLGRNVRDRVDRVTDSQIKKIFNVAATGVMELVVNEYGHKVGALYGKYPQFTQKLKSVYCKK